MVAKEGHTGGLKMLIYLQIQALIIANQGTEEALISIPSAIN